MSIECDRKKRFTLIKGDILTLNLKLIWSNDLQDFIIDPGLLKLILERSFHQYLDIIRSIQSILDLLD